ncbi:MAG: aspartate kinase [Eggerthellaceae bacterium]|nr:aspartate kinase [Eggerthellaceae bacterium]
MSLIVMKFGGTSVATAERIRSAAARVVARRRAGDRVCVVVSAMGKTTDTLVKLAKEINPKPESRELDRLLSTGEQVSMALMAMAIDAQGYPAMSFTGRQAGIATDTAHAKAKIAQMDSTRILNALEDGIVPVVAGFQGIDRKGDITTLGRGGSDTTAVALAYSVGADVCEIYSDVEGVYSADPRICPAARKLSAISYDDMIELAGAGSGVLNIRAVEFARKFGVVIHSRSACSDAEGTYVKETAMMEEAVITGIAHDVSQVKVTLRGVPDAPGIAAKLFGALAERSVIVDIIIQNVSEDGFTDISFTCPKADFERITAIMEGVFRDLGAREYVVDDSIAMVSMVGTGMKTSPGVAAKAFRILAENDINILAISTSPIRLSVVVSKAQVAKAVQVLHTGFGMDAEELFEETALSADEIAAKLQKGR